MFIAPAEVEGNRLRRRLRGYDRTDVEKLLQEVAASYGQVWGERDQLRLQVEQLEKELGPLQEAGQHLTGSLVTAERAASEIRAKAKRAAEELLEKARATTKTQQAEAVAQSARLKDEIERLELVKRELAESIRAILLTGLELVDESVATKPTPVVELPSNHQTHDHATA
jgi:cell division septum initiation protein DivIVA